MVNSMVNQFFGPVFDDFDYIVYTHILMHLPSHLQQVPPTMPVPHVPVLAFCPSKKSVDFAPKCLGGSCAVPQLAAQCPRIYGFKIHKSVKENLRKSWAQGPWLKLL